MTEDKGTYAERNTAKRLENEGLRLKRGYLRGTLQPAVTNVVALVICLYAFRHFCIQGTTFDATKSPVDHDAFYYAQRDFSDGNLDVAAAQVAKILAKQPKHGPAHQLMARIELTRGNRTAALDHLRRSLDGSLNREEVTKWIASLEAAP